MCVWFHFKEPKHAFYKTNFPKTKDSHIITWGSWVRAFAKSHHALLILSLEAIFNFPSCPLCFKRQITLSAIHSLRTRSHLSAAVDIVEVNWVLILDENPGVIDQHNDQKAASNGGAKVDIDSWWAMKWSFTARRKLWLTKVTLLKCGYWVKHAIWEREREREKTLETYRTYYFY